LSNSLSTNANGQYKTLQYKDLNGDEKKEAIAFQDLIVFGLPMALLRGEVGYTILYELREDYYVPVASGAPQFKDYFDESMRVAEMNFSSALAALQQDRIQKGNLNYDLFWPVSIAALNVMITGHDSNWAEEAYSYIDSEINKISWPICKSDEDGVDDMLSSLKKNFSESPPQWAILDKVTPHPCVH
jgi:hypothetical protein